MLDTNKRQEVTYFTGIEVEHTIMKGEKTLFVVGVRPTEEIVKHALDEDINHIYLGTSQSFVPTGADEWAKWDTMITELLKLKYWVTLDFGVEHSELIHEYGWNEFDRFIAMISVKLPYIKLFNYNATLKIDDTTWGASNPGVWAHQLHKLMDAEKFTHWDQYTGDKTL